MVVYSAVFLVIGVPAFFLVSHRRRLPPSPPGLSRTSSPKLKVLLQRSKRRSHKFKWGPDDLFGDDGPLRPPPSPGRKMMGQPSPQSLDDTSVSCNLWDESAALPGEPSTTRAGMAAYVTGFFFFLTIASASAPRTDQPTNHAQKMPCGGFSSRGAAAAIGFSRLSPSTSFRYHTLQDDSGFPLGRADSPAAERELGSAGGLRVRQPHGRHEPGKKCVEHRSDGQRKIFERRPLTGDVCVPHAL
jgi:hypothetical protein